MTIEMKMMIYPYMEMNLADVVGDGRGSKVLDGQASLAVPEDNCL